LPNALILLGLVTAAPRKWLRFAVSATAGSLTGGILLYVVSRLLFESWGQRLIAFYGATDRWNEVVMWVQSGWGFAIIFITAMVTGFFRLGSLAAGFTAMNPFAFALALTASRGVRWTAECAAVKFLGDRARTRPAGSATVAALDGGIHGLGKKILEEAGEPVFSFEFFPPKSEKMEEQLWSAIQTLAQAQAAYAQARHQFILGRLQLQQAAGALTEADLANVNALLQ